MGVTIEQTTIEQLPTGKYVGKIASIEANEGKFGPQLKWNFEVKNPDGGDPAKITAWCSQKFNPMSKLYGWVRATLYGGGDIPKDYTLDTDDLINRPVTLVVVEQASDDGKEYSKVDQVLPYKKPNTAPPPPPEDLDF